MISLIDEREKRNDKRKKFKAQIDKEITLSHTPKTAKLTTHRLLDEGAVVGDDYVDFFIKKGTIEKFVNGKNEHLDNISDDFVGSVNLGHENFSTFPFIIGEFTKEDFSVVDTENGRKALDISLHLYEDSMFVEELKKQPYDIGLSAEFYYHVDEEASAEYGIEVIDEICVFAYALVGECGNVNSDGLKLKGEAKVDIKTEGIEEAREKLNEIIENVEEARQELDEEVSEEPIVAEENADEETDGEEVCEEESGLDKAEEAFNALREENKQLNEKIEVLESKLSRVQKKLKAKNEEIENFTNKFKGLSVSLGLKDEVKKEKVAIRHNGNNGIGDF